MYVCVFWVLSCCHTLHPTAGCNYHRDRVHKKQKTKNQKNKNMLCWCLLLCCWSAAVCLVCCCVLCAVLCCHFLICWGVAVGNAGVCGGTAKNDPESPGKNHVTYPRKAVPVSPVTGYPHPCKYMPGIYVVQQYNVSGSI